MAAKSVLKSSVSAVLAAVIGLGLLVPAAAQAQENRDRGERGLGRMERSMSAPAPSRAAPPSMPTMPRQMDRPAPSTAQVPQWQNSGQSRGPAVNPQQSWNGRPAWSSQGSSQPERGPRQDGPTGATGRPSWQQGDRGNANTAPAWTGRPAWQQGDRSDRADRGNGGNGGGRPDVRPGGTVVPPTTATPSWGGRNPTYADPRRNPSGRPQPGQGDWKRDGDRNDRDRNDRERDWNRDNGNNWNRGNAWNRDRNWNRSNDWKQGRYASSQWRGNNHYYGNNGYGRRDWGRPNWDRDGWRRDNRYNWSSWRNNHRDIFRGGFYYAPFSGYSYSRLSIGLFLGNAFFNERYWLADPYAYRLPPAYGNYRWVRYYDDVLLVDIYSGEVVDVIYEFFD